MARALLVGGLLALAALAFAAAAVPWAACPECDGHATCFRGERDHRLTAVDRWLRAPSDPGMIRLLRREGSALDLAEAARRQGLATPDVLSWRGKPDFFESADAVRIDRSRLLVALYWRQTSTEDGAPCRAVLLDRTGEELDRLDVWLEDSPHLNCALRRERAAVDVWVEDKRPRAPAYLRRSGAEAPLRVPAAEWPPAWEDRGLGWIVVRDGRLALEPP
jgi:hypothetical protein